ncbi:MAG: hypothetical protein ACON4U_17165 [Myxococcota bacterium]
MRQIIPLSILLMCSIQTAHAEEKASEAPAKKETAEAAAEQSAEDPETDAKEEAQQSSGKILVVHNSVEETLTRAKTLAALRNAGMKDLEVDDINLIVLNDLIRAGSYQSLDGADLMTCNTTQASLSRLRNMIQQAENEVSYLEFKKAEATLRAAEQSLNCLKDFADAELAFQLYFFQGMVLFDNGNKEGAQQAFHNALTFMPTKRWDDYFAPDAKPLFDEIKSEIVKSAEQKLTIYPTPARDSIWIDGFPADGNTHMLKPGAHLIQINTGESTRSYRVVMGETEADFIIPAALSPDSLTWTQQTERLPELNKVASALASANKGSVLVNGSEVWLYDDASKSIKELEVPRSLYISGRDPKVVAMGSLAAVGALASLSGVTMMGISASQANSYADQAQDADEYKKFTNAKNNYDELEGLHNVYTGIFIGGTVMSAGSAALLYRFKQQ